MGYEASVKIQIYAHMFSHAKTCEIQLINEYNWLQKIHISTNKLLKNKNTELHLCADRCDELTYVLEEMNRTTKKLSNQLVHSEKQVVKWKHEFEHSNDDLLLTRKTNKNLQFEHSAVIENIKVVATRYELLDEH